MKDKVLGELKNLFRPEFLDRIDASVVFRSLTREEIRSIVDLQLARVLDQLAAQQMELTVTDAAKDAIIEKVPTRPSAPDPSGERSSTRSKTPSPNASCRPSSWPATRSWSTPGPTAR